jgi:hypothetical protein
VLDDMDLVCSTSPERLPLLGLNNFSPSSRKAMAGLYGAASIAGGVGALLAPHGLPAAAMAAAGAACAVWAARAWRSARKPFFLLPEGRRGLPLAAFEVLPGRGIGRFELGPPGADTLHALRDARACWYSVMSVVYVFGGPNAWMAVCFRLRHDMIRHDRPPDTGALEELVWVETSHPFHATPEGLAPGLPAREAGARIGPPLEVTYPACGDVHLHYRGLRVVLRDGYIRSLRVLTTDPMEAIQPWNL